ncbi:hypothetical protein BGZ65_002943, partial [Modicella reniformis]
MPASTCAMDSDNNITSGQHQSRDPAGTNSPSSDHQQKSQQTSRLNSIWASQKENDDQWAHLARNNLEASNIEPSYVHTTFRGEDDCQ